MIGQGREKIQKKALKMESGLHIGGVFAVLPVDAFTGQPVRTRDFAVEIDGERPPVKKRDGFFVFSRVLPKYGEKGVLPSEKNGVFGRGEGRGLESEKGGGLPRGNAGAVTIKLSGRGYRETIVYRRTQEAGERVPVLIIPVNPGRDYPFPPDTLFLEGRIPAGSRLRAAFLQKAGCFRLAQDYHAGGTELFLCMSGRKDTAGGFFFLCMESGLSGGIKRCAEEESGLSGGTKRCVSGEFCLLGAAGGAGGGCLLQKPLERDYDGKRTCLYPARVQEAGEREEDYFFAFPASVQDGMIYCRLETAEGSAEYRLPARGAEVKRMDF